MQIGIQYCVVWNYEPRATSLGAEIEDTFPDVEVRLIEASGGLFEVTVDGDLVYSKKATGRHAEPGEVVGLIRERTEA